MGTLLQDIRFALRSFRRAPAFPLAAIVTLALGIGATTAIFSTLNAVLLKPLPYPGAEDLYNIRTTLTDGRVTTGMLSNGEISRLNDPQLSIVRAAGLQSNDLTLLHDDGTPEHVKVYGVTEGFFELFGLPMTLGGFAHENFVPPAPPPPNTQPAPGPPPVVVISYRIWQDLYRGDPSVVGKAIHFAEAATTIGGVAPREFDTPHGGDFWFALRLGKDDINHFFDGFMRLKPRVPLERANAEMASIMKGLSRDFPAADTNRAYVTKPLVTAVVGDLGPILTIVMSATGLLLLLACVNVTNLLLARGAARAREMAVRVSLGAARGRIVRQLLTESAMLSGAGAVVGAVIAYVGLRALLTMGASKLPRLDVVAFDGRVLLFVLATLVVSGLLVGFAPALRLASTDVRTLMTEGNRSTSGGRGTARWLSAMTVVEIALAITLVAGAGWLVRGFAGLRNTDLGFVPDKHLVFDVSFLGPKYPNDEAVAHRVTRVDRATRKRSWRDACCGDIQLPVEEHDGELAHRAVPWRDARSRASDRDTSALRQRGLLRVNGYETAAGARLRAGRSAHDDPGRYHQQGVREALPVGARSAGPAVLGRLSEPGSTQRGDGRRRRRRRAAEDGER